MINHKFIINIIITLKLVDKQIRCTKYQTNS